MTKEEVERRLNDILSAVPVHAHRFHAGRGDKWDENVDTLNGIDDVFEYIRPALLTLIESVAAEAKGGIMTSDEMKRWLDDLLGVTPEEVVRVSDDDRRVSMSHALERRNNRLRPALLALLESASAGGGIPGPTEATQEDVEVWMESPDPVAPDYRSWLRAKFDAVFAARIKRRG